MNSDFKVIILAIFDTNDFANKAMTDIHGKPMIEHVFDSAKKSGASEIVIATDNARVGMSAEDFGATVCMIIDEELKGINRLAEVVDKMGWGDETIIVNLPGDAPLTPSSIVTQVANNLAEQTEAECAVLYSMATHGVAAKETTVTAVADSADTVLYLSRNPIPYQPADAILSAEYKCLIDINAYRAGLLRIYRNLSTSVIDRAEGIDELKILFNGMNIHAGEANNLIGHRVLSEEDIEKVKIQIAPSR